MNKRFATPQRPIHVGLILIFLTFACAPAGETSPNDSTDAPADSVDLADPRETAVLAVVNGEEIRADRVDDRIRKNLFDQTFGDASGAAKLYDARRETLDEVIREVLTNRAAKAAGQDRETWLTAAIEARGPVRDEAVAEFFEENKSRMGADPQLEDFDARIRMFLGAQQAQEVYAELYDAAEISIDMPRQRAEVAAIGPSLGPENAPITIVEFSDFQCPYCARVVGTVKELVERYPEQVRIVFRHLPLSFHAQAKLAAQASVCAENQENFWPYHDKLFENQRAMAREQLVQYATDLELDVQAFEACLEAPETVATVDADLSDAQSLGATGTPAFFVNGIMLSGAQPVDSFVAIIEEELAQSGS